jgi:hypothetical protein
MQSSCSRLLKKTPRSEMRSTIERYAATFPERIGIFRRFTEVPWPADMFLRTLLRTPTASLSRVPRLSMSLSTVSTNGLSLRSRPPNMPIDFLVLQRPRLLSARTRKPSRRPRSFSCRAASRWTPAQVMSWTAASKNRRGKH